MLKKKKFYSKINLKFIILFFKYHYFGFKSYFNLLVNESFVHNEISLISYMLAVMLTGNEFDVCGEEVVFGYIPRSEMPCQDYCKYSVIPRSK